MTRRRLYLDDAFLFLAFVCLCAGTAVLFLRLKIVFLEFAVLRQVPAAYAVALQDLDNLVAQNKWALSWIVMSWTSIFAVKWCYFSFFYPLMRNMARWFVWYYRVGIFLSVACWILVIVGGQLLVCPYMGKEAGGMFVIQLFISDVF